MKVSATVQDVSGENIRPKVYGLASRLIPLALCMMCVRCCFLPANQYKCTNRQDGPDFLPAAVAHHMGGWSIDLSLGQVRTLRLTQCPLPFALPASLPQHIVPAKVSIC